MGSAGSTGLCCRRGSGLGWAWEAPGGSAGQPRPAGASSLLEQLLHLGRTKAVYQLCLPFLWPPRFVAQGLPQCLSDSNVLSRGGQNSLKFIWVKNMFY